ncbi:PREDICTED: serine/arginine-rich SC35-like splicing factor SCL28 isoform X1 [Ipomoea nil]|uniref:serine/arginine-rich SC35-like splicing factor SCL28 isoform X1 n=1 Tax=Ipomoea nil TaxID=35883 RepID=UPI000901E718|nr:PREDICTED: serine/arginine-rich SC35-like splicing factor SCL28 isoform X1 [Ipomoea nil]XP_019172790.1 PREDICTED: serine/arginine-rich SC35-like splicing factor SCL28 isoform X1 [Ipomoea nil]
MGRYRSRSRSYSPVRSNRYEDRRDRRGDRRSPAPSGLLVRNISLKSRPEDLRVHFEHFGPLRDVYLPKNYYTGEPRGFGFVKFRYPEDAAEAKKYLNHTVIDGREIQIVFADENRKTPQEMRRLSNTNGRRSSRRHSPSRSPRRRYRSYSRSPTPTRQDLRDRDRHGRGDYYSPRRSRSLSRSLSPRGDRSMDRRARRSRSIPQPVSPHGDRNGKTQSPRTKSQAPHAEDNALKQSESPRENSRV